MISPETAPVNPKGFSKSHAVIGTTVLDHTPRAKSGLRYWQQTMHIAPLVVFRIVFALMLLGGIIRFWAKGWIEELYIKPSFFFSYYGFEWVKPLGVYTYLLFGVCAIAA